MKSDPNSPYVVRFVSFPATRLVDHEGQYYSSIKVDDALRLARNVGLDLVCFNKPDIGALALCKVIDFGKWKYENEKKKKEEEKKHRKEVKEIRFSPNIEMNDVQHKVNQIIDFLDIGDDVVMVMKLKGREKLHVADAEKKMGDIAALLNGHGKEISRKTESNLIMVKMMGIAKNGS